MVTCDVTAFLLLLLTLWPSKDGGTWSAVAVSDRLCPTAGPDTLCGYLPGSCFCVNPYDLGGYYSANDMCVKYITSSQIVSIHNEAENEVIRHVLQQDGGHDGWIGLQFKDGRFVWEDGSVAEYYNWEQEGQKGNSSACYKMSTKTGLWTPASTCIEQINVACRYQYGSTPRPTVPSTNGPKVTVIAVTSSVAILLVVALVVGAVLFRRWYQTRSHQQEYRSLAASLGPT